MKSGNFLVKFLLAEGVNALSCIIWAGEEEIESLTAILEGAYLCVTCQVSYETRFGNDYQGVVKCLEKAEAPSGRKDMSEEKRVELHIHSKFSAKDACSRPSDIVKQAAAFGHEAIALTDHGVVQGFPEASDAQRALAKQGIDIKLIFGMEAYLIDEGAAVYFSADEEAAESIQYCAKIEIETIAIEGEERVSSVSAERWPLSADGRGAESEKYYASLLLSEDKEKSLHIELEGLDEAEIDEQISASAYRHRRESLFELQDFLKEALLLFDGSEDALNRLRWEGFQVRNNEARLKFNRPFVDLNNWSELEKSVSDREIKIELLFDKLWEATEYCPFNEINVHYGQRDEANLRKRKVKPYHLVLLAENDLGLYHLYRLVSLSNLNHFYHRPRIFNQHLRYFGAGLIKGAACVYGEVFQKVLQAYRKAQRNYDDALAWLCEEEQLALAKSYDYLEIQPLGNNRFMLEQENSGIINVEDLQNLNRLVIDWAKAADTLVCATCDSHFLEPKDDLYRRIVMSSIGFSDNEQPAPLYFRSTDEMLEEFDYLGPELAKKVVIDNTRAIAARVNPGMLPFPDGSYPPIITTADENVRKLTLDTAFEQYGKDGKIPDSIQSRVEKELNAIISNGYAVMYDIAHKLVKKSNDDGYVVGSRGSVGSSVVANFCGISEVNPLPPHYICPECHYYEEDNSGTYGSGFDLPAKTCPECGAQLKRDGQDIPFATFLGFNGDKQPDIDLNFSGDYQPRAHDYIEEMFGRSHTFRAGTIQGYAEKKSEALVYKFAEGKGSMIWKSKAAWLAKGIQGIKESTGQHPGGIVVVPKEREIYDFTPVQYPADKKDSGVITTHFDFHALDETILKLDILGHDDPTMLKMLGDMTGVKIEDIPIPDERVMALFKSTAAIGIDPEKSTIGSATIGLPEVGTMMAREMIQETSPTRFYDLVQLSGLSHGTGVWMGNAQDLIRAGTCTINEVIGCRDSIMTTLIYAGLEPKHAFKIMEKVRKGRGLSEEQEAMMRENNVPEWYIDSCKKIKYMFPKAHAAAYSISTQRIAWFKVYHPEAYYCAWFTVRGDEFSAEVNLLSPEAIAARRLEQRRNFSSLEKPDQKKFYILELVEEMNARGIHFLPIDLEKSEASTFTSPEKNWIRPPLDVIGGVSAAIAKQIVDAREEGGPFQNWDELKNRAKIGDACILALKNQGVLDHIPESSQINLFELAGQSFGEV